MENHFLDGGLARPSKTHQQYPWLAFGVGVDGHVIISIVGPVIVIFGIGAHFVPWTVLILLFLFVRLRFIKKMLVNNTQYGITKL